MENVYEVKLSYLSLSRGDFEAQVKCLKGFLLCEFGSSWTVTLDPDHRQIYKQIDYLLEKKTILKNLRSNGRLLRQASSVELEEESGSPFISQSLL